MTLPKTSKWCRFRVYIPGKPDPERDPHIIRDFPLSEKGWRDAISYTKELHVEARRGLPSPLVKPQKRIFKPVIALACGVDIGKHDVQTLGSVDLVHCSAAEGCNTQRVEARRDVRKHTIGGRKKRRRKR